MSLVLTKLDVVHSLTVRVFELLYWLGVLRNVPDTQFRLGARTQKTLSLLVPRDGERLGFETGEAVTQSDIRSLQILNLGHGVQVDGARVGHAGYCGEILGHGSGLDHLSCMVELGDHFESRQVALLLGERVDRGLVEGHLGKFESHQTQLVGDRLVIRVGAEDEVVVLEDAFVDSLGKPLEGVARLWKHVLHKRVVNQSHILHLLVLG